MIALVLATLIARELLHVAWEAFANRHKPGVFPRDYRRICRRSCGIRSMTEKGWRVRTKEGIQRAAERVHSAVIRG